jgi:hypothetical protein
MWFHSKTYWGSLELYDLNTCIQIYNKKIYNKKKVQVLSLSIVQVLLPVFYLRNN